MSTCVPRLAFLAWCCLSAAHAWGAPQITQLNPRGIQRGQTQTVIVQGQDLADDPRLVSELSFESQQLEGKPTPKTVSFQVKVPADAASGIYAVRVATKQGISNPLLLAIDHLPHAAWTTELDSLPIALLGELGGNEIKRTTFTGKAGETWWFEVEARRTGAGCKPVLRLLDEAGKQIAFAAGHSWLGGDAQLSATLPRAGKYTLELHDQLYRAPGGSRFRLRISPTPGLSRVHPAAVKLGESVGLRLLAAGDQTSSFPFIARLNVPGQHAVNVPASLLAAGPRPTVIVSDATELVEQASSNNLQEATSLPLGISGIIEQPGETDSYLVSVPEGEKLRLEVQAQRLHSPLDAVLVVSNEKQQQLLRVDDSPGSSDPLQAEFIVPKGVSKLVLQVSDLVSRGGPDFNYRLVVAPANQPDFSLSLTDDAIQIPAGGTQVIVVQSQRRGMNDRIELNFSGLPSAVRVDGGEMPPGSEKALVALTAPADFTGAGLMKLLGNSAGLARLAQSPDLPGAAAMPYLRNDIGWSATPALPISLAWTPSSQQFIQGQPHPGQLHVDRLPNTSGKIRVRLLTTQNPIKKKIKEKNQDKEVEDLSRMLRLESDLVIAPDQADVSVPLFVPGDLPRVEWDVALVAELLTPDGKGVVATAYTPVRRFSVAPAFTLELTSAARAEGIAGSGMAGEFVGNVQRTPGYARPVMVTLQGLPAGYSAPVVQLDPQESEFKLPLVFPYQSKPGELKNVKLIAVADRNLASAARSNEVSVEITVKQGEKPQPEQPRLLFEDEEAFLAQLSQGKASVTLDADKHSGTHALRVAPDQKYNPNIADWQFKIRENPEPGEYRYLRFAWRKKGGTTICLQLAHDGQFGPGNSEREGAKFRYHAGPGGEQYGGSVELANKIPTDYVVVTRDLFADFGEFTLTGIAFSAVDGSNAAFDGLYLGRNEYDFDLLKK